jgi:hypothetical protein
MRTASLLIALSLCSLAHAEAEDASFNGVLIGVAKDGSFVYESTSIYADESDAGGGSRTVVAVFTGDGAKRISFERADAATGRGAWRIQGADAVLRPLVQDRPRREELLQRLTAQLQLEPLQPSTIAWKLSRCEKIELPGERCVEVTTPSGPVMLVRLDGYREALGEIKHQWKVKMLEHPASQLLFVESSYHTRPAEHGFTSYHAVHWVARPASLSPRAN